MDFFLFIKSPVITTVRRQRAPSCPCYGETSSPSSPSPTSHQQKVFLVSGFSYTHTHTHTHTHTRTGIRGKGKKRKRIPAAIIEHYSEYKQGGIFFIKNNQESAKNFHELGFQNEKALNDLGFSKTDQRERETLIWHK